MAYTDPQSTANEQAANSFNQWYATQRGTTGVVEIPQQYQNAIAPNHVLYNGTLWNRDSLSADQKLQQQAASGAMKNIGTADKPMYVPTGSAGDFASQGMSYQDQLKQPTVQAQIANQALTPQAPDVPQVNTAQPNPSTANATPFTQPSPQQALAAAQASGAAPQDGGAARSALQQFMPTDGATFYKPDPNKEQVYDATGKPLSYDEYIKAGGKPDFSNVRQGLPDTTGVDQILAQDKGYQQLLKDQAEYNSVVNQGKTLTQTYSDLTKELGIPALNTQLMNMKNVIDGTENDIRAEVTKAGGFATESQVQALTSARNKVLIQNYNNLLNVKSQAMDTLNTMMGLAEKDKSLAQQSILQKMQIDQQLYEYQQKMATNAANQFENIVSKVGYAGLYQMTGGNPFYVNLVEKSLGLPTGSLARMGTASTNVVKSETKNLGTTKNPNWVHIGYDAQGNIVSRQPLNGSLSSGSQTSNPSPTRSTYSSPRGNYPTPSTSAIKQIIAAHPNEWGHAADAIDAKYGKGTATKYDDLLKAAYAKSTSKSTSSSSFESL